MTEEDRLAIERQEEAEYLATLSNFHWFVYPFFKTIEVACDKVFGCKSRLKQENEKRRQEHEKIMAEKYKARENAKKD